MRSPEVALPAVPVRVDALSWTPQRFLAHERKTEDLLETRHPAYDLTDDETRRLVTPHLAGRPLETYGCWVFYPWSGRLVRVLPEAEFRELRTSRNRNKVTAEEQQLLGKRIGVVGLSVGQAAALTLAMEQVGGELVLADFDALGLSNLNRLRSGVHNLETSDRGMLDIERFDLEPGRPLLHGLIEGWDLERFRSLSTLEKILAAFELVVGTNVSTRTAASLIEVRQTLKTWPQLASAVALAGATSTDTPRRILLGQLSCSGRFHVDLERTVAAKSAVVVAPTVRADDVSPQAKASHVSLSVERSAGELTAEQVRTLVHFGTMAPSGGNSQPWTFHYAHGQLECFHAPERSKSFLDYSNLASYVAFGACVENMELVAAQQGLGVKVAAFPNGLEGPVCKLRFEKRPGNADSALFEQIPRRITNRKPGNREPLNPETASRLSAAADARGARLRLIEAEQDLTAIADILGPGDRLRFISKVMHREFMGEIRWNRTEVERSKDGLDVATLELGAMERAGLRLATSMGAMQLVGRLGVGRVLEKPTRNSIAGASAMGLLTIPGGHTPQAMFAGGRALQRLWLTATAQGYWLQPMTALVCLFWRLLDGAPDLSTEQVEQLASLRQKYQAVFDVSANEGEVMLFRLTRSEGPTTHSLRRPVDEVLSFAAESSTTSKNDGDSI